MAEGGIRETYNDQSCPICLETFNVPRTLPCQHIFCHKCLSDFIVTSGQIIEDKPSFSCPVCRTIVYPSSEAKDLKEWANLFPQNIRILTLPGKLKEKVEYVCDSCLTSGSSNNSSGFCLDCKEHVCEACIELHGKINALRRHKIITRDELAQNPSVAMSIDSENRCMSHAKEIQYFCKDHDAIGCVTCFLMEHIACKNMVYLKTNAQAALEEDPIEIVDAMKRIEEHLVNYIEKTESKVKNLEAQTTDLSKVIKTAKKRIIRLLDILEKKIDQKGKQIYHDESTKKCEEVQQCQSLLATIRNSYQLLDAVIRLGSKTQVFISTRRAQKQLNMYREQIGQKYRKVESKEVRITLHDSLNVLLSLQYNKLATVESQNEIEELSLSGVVRTPGAKVTVREAVCPTRSTTPDYEGATFLINDNVMLTDIGNYTCCLYDSEFEHISDYKLSAISKEVCVVDEEEIAVSLPSEKKIQLLTSTAPIKPTRSITTRYYCDGMAVLNKHKLVISGYNNTGNMNYYWSILTTSGKEECYHEIEQKGDTWTYLAVNRSRTRLYMSCCGVNTVYCFGLDGHLIFTYKDDSLTAPMGIGLDRDDNVYVAGYLSHNLHQLSRDGLLLQVITSGIPSNPRKIAFHRNGSTFFLTNSSERQKIHMFRLQ